MSFGDKTASLAAATYEQAREKSRAALADAGLAAPDVLPLLDVSVVRHKDEVVSRLFCMQAAAAVSYGFDRSAAIQWLTKEGLEAALLQSESDFLHHACGEPDLFRHRIEAMWALAWSIGIIEHLNFAQNCDSRFVTMLPNLKTGESGLTLRNGVVLRSVVAIVTALDLAYCLHWALRDAAMAGNTAQRQPASFVVMQRRWALEWIVSDEDWDGIALDT